MPYSVVIYDEELGWQNSQISVNEALRLSDSDSVINKLSEQGATTHMLLERRFDKERDQSVFSIKEHTFPSEKSRN